MGPTMQGDSAAALVRAADPTVLADALASALPLAREVGKLRVAVDPQRV
jgi:hypothetical protein